ncbi:MAG: hypothetical protein ACI4MK_03975, partial [Aristaeellaceae bacterium]
MLIDENSMIRRRAGKKGGDTGAGHRAKIVESYTIIYVFPIFVHDLSLICPCRNRKKTLSAWGAALWARPWKKLSAGSGELA